MFNEKILSTARFQDKSVQTALFCAVIFLSIEVAERPYPG